MLCNHCFLCALICWRCPVRLMCLETIKKSEKEKRMHWLRFFFTLHHPHPHPHTHVCSQMRNIECVSAYEFVLQNNKPRSRSTDTYLTKSIDFHFHNARAPDLSECHRWLIMASPVETFRAAAEVDRWIATLTISLNQLTVIQIRVCTASKVRLFSIGLVCFHKSIESPAQMKQIENRERERGTGNKNQWNIHECILSGKQKMLSRQHQVIQT